MKILTGKDVSVLRMPARPVEQVTSEIRLLIRDMRKVMRESGGIGLAANQVGVDLQIFVVELYYTPVKEGKFFAFINPKIISRSGTEDEREEACLSLPGVTGAVKRSKRILVEGLNELGKRVKIKTEGFLARVFQHEIDHLNGVLFIDKAKKIREFKI